LVSSGSEGKHGCEEDMALYEKIHSDPNIDYLNIHIWPYNWGWVKADSLNELLSQAIENTKEYIAEHLSVAQKYSKPLVIEEFGFPRDNFRFSIDTPTIARDRYYDFLFNMVEQSCKQGSVLAGCNFWGWGGFAKLSSNHVYWEKGDDYTGDPAQEEQGLNSVFATDSTVNVIKTWNEKMK
jgi:mannan endo-1,4-beta-mannosidase